MTTEQTPRIIFFGDSITQMGVNPGGYITLIREGLKNSGTPAEVIGAGVGGNKVPDLRERLASDVLSRHPSTVVVFIGINDVWHDYTPGLKGTPAATFEKGLDDIVKRIMEQGARVVLCTPGVIGEKWDGSNQCDLRLDEYAGIIRTIAQRRGTALCDLRKAFISYLQGHNGGMKESGILTTDTVHLSDEGNRLVAGELLKFVP